MEDFKMNRTIVNKSTFAEADDHTSFYSDKTPLERLNIACHIINTIYNSSPSQKIERIITSSRKHKK